MTKNINVTTKLCCLILAVLPIMQLYGFSFFPSLTFADYLLLIFILISIFTVKGLNNLYWLALTVYLLAQPLLILCLTTNNAIHTFDMVGTAWRLAFYTISICFFSKQVVTINGLQWALRIIGTINVIYAVLQFFCGTYLRVSLTPYLPFLPIVRTGLEDQQIGWINLGMIIRARGFFAEPSHIAIFLLLALFVELLMPNKNKYYVFVYIIGIIVSYSSTGFIALAVIFLYYIVLNRRILLSNLIGRKMLIGILLILAMFILLWISGYLRNIINHIFSNGEGITSQSHFKDIFATLRQPTSMIEHFIGHGLQDVKTGYTPGWIRTYYCLGILGVVLYLYVFLQCFIKTNSFGRAILFLFIFLNIGTEIMLGLFLIVFMAVIIQFNQIERATIKYIGIGTNEIYERNISTPNN